jgi:hypothetical protein
LSRLCAAILLPLALACGRSARADGAAILVSLDHAKVINLPAGTRDIILGNPMIVDVTRLPGGEGLVLTGKAFGETNLVALDNQGQIAVDVMIRVALPSGPDLVVQRGQQRSTYSCGAACQPRGQLGDAAEVVQDGMGKVRARNGLATSTEPGSNPGPKGGGKL